MKATLVHAAHTGGQQASASVNPPFTIFWGFQRVQGLAKKKAWQIKALIQQQPRLGRRPTVPHPASAAARQHEQHVLLAAASDSCFHPLDTLRTNRAAGEPEACHCPPPARCFAAMAPPRGGGAVAGRGSGRSAIRQGDAHTAAGGAAAGPLTRAARRVAARALGMLQDDSPLLSLKIRLLVMLYAFCWADDSAFTLSMYPGRHVGSSSDWLQERIGEGMSLLDTFALPGGLNPVVANPSSPQTRPVCPAGLLMLLRWAASFLPLPARVPFAALAAAAAAHSVAVCSRRALAAGCAGGASRRQKLQAVLLLQLLQLAYWLPAARAVWCGPLELRLKRSPAAN